MPKKTHTVRSATLPAKTAGSGVAQPNTDRPAPPASSDKTAEYWAARINVFLLKSIAALVMAGLDLIAAKAQLLHGEWQRLVESGILYVDLRGAQRLMKLAENKVIAKATNWSLLPASPQALCALAGADPDTLQAALDAGKITSRTTIQEANQFRSSHPASGSVPQTTPAPHDFDMDRSLKRCSDILWAEFNKWPDVRRDFLLDQIQVVVQGMANANSGTTPIVNGPAKDAPPVHQSQTV